MARYHRERRAAVEIERKRLDRQKPFAWLLIAIGGALFIGNHFGMVGTPSLTFETICMVVVLMGGFWLWHVRSEKERSSRHSMEQAKEERNLPRVDD